MKNRKKTPNKEFFTVRKKSCRKWV